MAWGGDEGEVGRFGVGDRDKDGIVWKWGRRGGREKKWFRLETWAGTEVELRPRCAQGNGDGDRWGQGWRRE